MAAPSPKASPAGCVQSARLDVDDIHVAVEQQCPAAATAEAPDELRPAVEREPLGHPLMRPHPVRAA
jgi:hypothetical protein